MKIRWAPTDQTGRSHLKVFPGDYDGHPPIQSLTLDTTTAVVEPEIELAAGALAFGPYCGGELTTKRPVSPLVAAAVEEFLRPQAVRCHNVTYTPATPYECSAELLVSTSDADLPAPSNTYGSGRVARLRLLPNDRWQGALGSIDDVSISSNANHLAALQPEKPRYYAYVASALLLSTDFRARTLTLPLSEAPGPEFQSVRRLLRAVNRNLKWISTNRAAAHN